MGKRAKLRTHYHKINELDNPRQRATYRYYMRRFWHMYRVYPDGMERNVGEYHYELLIRRKIENLIALRFHIGNDGSETPWDGHLTILWVSFYWGYSRGRRLASWLTRCSGYKYDSRDWTFRISDKHVWWEFANHSDMCDKTRPKARGYVKGRNNKKRRRYNSWRRGSWNLSILDKIWGPKRHTYEQVDGFATMLKFKGEGEYPVIIDLKRVYFGRTKVDRSRHIVTWALEVDAPGGIPTHVDHSGGWKGDRTHGFGLDFQPPVMAEWRIDAEAAVRAWVLKERSRTGVRTL